MKYPVFCFCLFILLASSCQKEALVEPSSFDTDFREDKLDDRCAECAAVEFINFRGYSVDVQWQATHGFKSFLIKVNGINQNGFQTSTVVNGNTTTLAGLKPMKNYIISVYALLEEEGEVLLEQKHFNSGESAAPLPKNITSRVNEKGGVIRWEKGKQNEKYIVQITRMNTVALEYDIVTGENYFEFTRSEKPAGYSYRIAAIKDNKKGGWTPWIKMGQGFGNPKDEKGTIVYPRATE
jgi:hypothetical protein